MNAALLGRDLSIAVRTPAFAVAIAVHVTALAAFILLWGGGVPLLPGENLYQQQLLVQAVILAGLLPWAAARCGPEDRGDDLALLSAIAAAPPSRIVAMRAASRFLLLSAIVLAGIPLVLVAAQIGAVPLAMVAGDLAPAVAIAALAAAAAVASTVAIDDPLVAWLAATGTTIAVLTALGATLPRSAATAGSFAIALTTVAMAAARANATSRYLSERA